MYRHLFLEAITMHNFTTLCILLITLPEGSNKPYLVLVIITFLSSLYEHFKKNPKQIGEVDYKKKAQQKYVYRFFSIYFYIYWAFLGVFHSLMFFYYIDWMKEKSTVNSFCYGPAGLCLLIYTAIFRDFSVVDNFSIQKKAIFKEKLI